ncbi:alpha-hydroxy acid oxidase [Salinisphaera sp. SPP-AMP-43]|uniref:alpha-hydroxy acid oxidase n=1 Tax=Salinisphaera sp. SPP-AMP-43 TaxID=3121288 RepID=UPI003C6E2727
MTRHHYAGRQPQRAHSIADLQRMAQRRLPGFAYEYVAGGAQDELTLADNRRAFAELGWRCRTLVDVRDIRCVTRLFGRDWPWPLGIAPTGYNGMLWPDADIALARAAAAFDLPFTLSTVACNSIEQVRAAAPKARLWFQLYSLNDREVENGLLERAQAADCEALVVTTDAVVLGDRQWDKRNYRAPGSLTWRNRLDVLRHPGWAARVLWPHGMPTLGNLSAYLPADQQTALGGAQFVGHQMNRGLDRQTLVELRERWPGRLIVKGILDPRDARLCAEIGADGIVVSNHGGRQVDGAPSALACIAAIRQAVGPEMTVLLDSGIRHGTDALKAIALGADGVLSGRATLYGVAAAGQAGAERALSLLTGQIEHGLGVIGCPSLERLGPDWLAPRGPAVRPSAPEAGDEY